MRYEHDVMIDAARCIGCGLCEGDCPAAALAVEDGRARVIARDCILCGHCVAICPKGAVSLSGFKEGPRELTAGAPPTLDAEQLLEAVGARRSIRRFTDEPVANEVIERIIEAGRLTPTAKNAQDVSYVVLRDDIARFEARAVRLFRRVFPLVKLANSMARRTSIDDRFFFKGAPAAIVVIARSDIDGALAASNMELMAQACGLGVLYSGYFATAAAMSRTLRRELRLLRGEKVVTALVIGHPAVRYRRTAPKEEAAVRWR